MKLSNDPTLTALSNSLSELHDWHTHGNAAYIGLRKSNGLKHCYRPLNSPKWVVKLTLGGRQLTLGTTDNGYAASRFADAVVVHFWKYRNAKREVFDLDLNYGVSQARYDLANYLALRNLVMTIESHLLESKVIELPATSEKLPDRYDARSNLQHTSQKFFVALRAACSILTETNPDAALLVETALSNASNAETCVRDISQRLSE